MNAITSLFATVFLAAGIGFANAGELVDVSITDRNTGESLEVYRHHGRLYVAGTPGDRYAVSLRNKSGGRVLTVISVDGVNALNGQTAATSQSGYVLSPLQTAEIAGWRKSMEEVAAFYFTSVADSYAGRTDRPKNVGVIGVAVYREAEPLPVPQAALSAGQGSDSGLERRMAEKASPAPSRGEAQMKKAENRLGTGHGERISAPTQYTEFSRSSEAPAEIVTIYYNSRANLLAQGIIPRPHGHSVPQAFPGGFVPDPRS